MKFLRTRFRRAVREQQAMMHAPSDNSNADDLWQQLEPVFEEAMSNLGEKDRALIALHFLENKNHSETAAALGIAEWATRKRVARAVEKLRMFFGKRGVAVSAAVLVVSISSHSVQAAPAALAKTVTVAAVAKGATASTSTLTLIKGAFMAWTKMKTAAVVGTIVILTAGTTTTLIVKHQHHRRAAEAMRVAAAQNIALAQGLQGRWRGSNTAHPGQSCTVNISGDQIEYRGTDPNDWLRGTFVLNDSVEPKELDITILEPAKSVVLCIYQTNEDRITIAAAEHGSSRRPGAFTPGRQVDVLALQHE